MNRNVIVYDGEDIVEEYEVEVNWMAIRARRDDALKDSDWRAVKDRVLPTAWKDYRQALRELPQNHDEANDAVDAWPVKPDE